MIGQTISHYKILEKLGEGGMGIVYKAHDTTLDRTVAIKFLPRSVTIQQAEKDRFKREARAAASLNHPNVATIHAIEEEDGESFIVMEYIEGQELKQHIAAGPLSAEEGLSIAIQIADGLQAAHRKGIVHRDIKSANIMLTRSHQVKIMDFGLARVAGTAHVTMDGSTLGTAAYMAPEQVRGEKTDERADIWAFGVVLYEMLTGRLPFGGDYAQAVMYSIVNEPFPSITSLRPDVPAELEHITERVLAKSAAERYQRVDDLLVELKDLKKQLDGGTSSVRVQKQPSIASIPDRSQEKSAAPNVFTKVLLASLVFVVIIVGIVWFVPSLRRGAEQVVSGMEVPSARHIAVLSFANVGNDPQNQALCDGLMETLTSKLSQLEQFQGELWVVPASEIRRSNVTSAVAAMQAFGINLAITGSVQRLETGLRVTMNLVDAATQRQLTSRLLDDPMTNLSVLQDEAVVQLASMLNVQLKPDAHRVLRAGNTTVPRAYELYLKGRGNLLRFDKAENLNAAIDFFGQALKVDPNYALAYAGLGEAYLQKYRATKDVQWVALARNNCSRAAALDDILAPVHITLGLLHNETGKYEEALAELQKALDLDPVNADAYRWRAKAFMALNRLAEAESTYKKAIETKPDYWAGYNALGGFYYRYGRYDDAIREFRKVVELTPKNATGYLNLGSTFFYLSRRKEAIAMFERALAIEPQYSLYANLGTLYYHEERYREAAQMYEKALQLEDSDFKVWGYLAAARTYTHDTAERIVEATRQAIARADEQRKLNPRDPDVISSLAGYYIRSGDRQQGRMLLREAVGLRPEEVLIQYEIGCLFELLNQRDSALVWIGASLKQGLSFEEVESNPELQSLRADSRFQKLVEAKKHTPQ